jgi:hypothetical protein
VQLQRQRTGHQIGTCIAATGQRGPKQAGDRDRKQTRRRVRTVINVLRQEETALAVSFDQCYRVDFQQNGSRTPLLGCHRVENMGGPARDVHRLSSARMLVQQIAEIGCGHVGGAHRENHQGI